MINLHFSGESRCSYALVESLKQIRLQEMMVPLIHAGRYLACRTVVKAQMSTPFPALFQSIVEDLNGDVEQLFLFNFRSARLIENQDEVMSWIPPGTILVIKEPHLKFKLESASKAKGGTFLSVESPSDVLIISQTDEVLLTKYGAEKWQAFILYIEKGAEAEKL